MHVHPKVTRLIMSVSALALILSVVAVCTTAIAIDNAVPAVAASTGSELYPVTQPIPTPGGVFGAYGQAHVDALSCSSVTSCTAIGTYNTAPIRSYYYGTTGTVTALPNAPFEEVYANGQWTASVLPKPAGADVVAFSQISCAGSYCIAVGRSAAKQLGVDPQALIEQIAPGDDLASPGPDGAPILRAVSCPAAGTCVAVGGHSIDTISVGTQWTVVSVPSVTAPVTLSAVACSDPGLCTAVGTESTTPSLPAGGVVSTLVGGVWSSKVLQTTVSLTTVSCPSPGRCVAAGEASAFSPTDHIAAEAVLSNQQWSSFALHDFSAGADITTMACSRSLNCMAAGSSTDLYDLTSTNVAVTSSVQSTRGLSIVACPTATVCLGKWTSPVGQLLESLTDAGGYYEVTAGGGVFTFGSAPFEGSAGGLTLVSPIVGMAVTPDGRGYWLGAADGGVFAFGDAAFFGSMGGKPLNQPIVGFAATPDGQGYWLVASDGGIFAFGDARFYGSMGGKPLNRPIVGMAPAPGGDGYWLVASDGGIFAFGDAPFFGSMGGKPLNSPVTGIAATPDGHGYWMVATDGGVFSFGDANFFGSAASFEPSSPVEGIMPTVNGRGYWEVAANGELFNFGNSFFDGTASSQPPVDPVVGIAA